MKKILSAVVAAAMGITSLAGVNALADNNTELNLKSRIAAFPGAEGGGMYTEGARASQTQEVYHVTNLNDSGEGSFRDAVSKSGRFVVFDVSGMIDLLSNVTLKSNTTILGQTAPGDGICIRGNNVKVGGNNVIVRYVRFRVGAHMADGTDTRAQDGFEITDDCQNVIIDHCSISWGTDENLSAYAVKDVTIQNCIVAEALNQSVHDKGEHSYAAIWGGVNLSIHHNIISSHKSRNPKIGTSETVAMTQGYTDAETVVDIRNNIFYNWGDKAGYGAENGANVNIVNNYYKPGPATPENKRGRIFEFSPGNKYQPGWSGAIYADGNYVADNGSDAAAVNENNWQVEKGTGIYTGAGVQTYQKLDKPNETYINDYPITTTDAQSAYEYVINNAGARLPKTDVVDTRILNDVINGTGASGSKGSVGLVDDPRDTVPENDAENYDDRGYPIWESVSRDADYDTDGDGIPDAWETAHGLNPSNPTDSLLIGPNGYTYLELYANGSGSGVNLKLDGSKAEISALESGTFDIYVDGKKTKTVEVSGNIPEGSTYISAGYDNGRLTQIKSSMDGFPEISAAEIKHFVWNGMDKMQPIETDFKAQADLSDAVGEGVHTVAAASADGKYLSNMEILKSEPVQHIDQETGDFICIINIDNVPTVIDGYSTVKFGGTLTVGVGSKEYKKVISVNDEVQALGNTSMLKVEKKDGKFIVSNGTSMFDWTQIGEYAAPEGDTAILSEISTANIGCRIITEKTQPSVEILNISENQRLGFRENAEIKLIPDTNAEIQQVVVRLNGKTVAFKEVGVNDEQTITVPISFDNIDAGTLEVLCVDKNLCTGSAAVKVSVSADLTPWSIADVGADENDVKTYVASTDDYTYKINTYDGSIGGENDKCGYIYQKFNGDNRIYYRSRMQSASQFGIMLRGGLENNSAMYWFGGVNEGGTIRYELLERKADGEAAEVKYTLDNPQANLYFIAEREGDKLNIYQTENGATVFTTKQLLTSIDCSVLGSEYYMGFAAVGGDSNPADAGWVSIDNNSGDNNYIWNFENGLDWLWQMQEKNVLRPSWTAEKIDANDETAGKMKIAPDNNYTSDRYIFREYQTDDGLMPELNISFCVTGENPAMNIYFQTGDTKSAYKAVIEDGLIKANNYELCSINNAQWYTLNIKTDMTLDGVRANASLISNMGEVLAGDVPIEEVTGTEFREQKNVEKKIPVTKSVYIEPKAGAEGAYYIDDVKITANEPSVKVTKAESWYTFTGLTNGVIASPLTVDGKKTVNGTELSGEVMTVSGGEIKDSDASKDKTIAGVGFRGKCRIKGIDKAITVPVTNGAVISVYAASASSSSTRPLYIDGKQYDVLAGAKFEYTYEGDSDSVVIYAGDNIDVYGISVINTIIENSEQENTDTE